MCLCIYIFISATTFVSITYMGKRNKIPLLKQWRKQVNFTSKILWKDVGIQIHLKFV